MKKLRRSLTAVALLPAAALVLSACSGDGAAGGSSEEPGGVTTLKVATIGLTSDGSLLAGMEQGFFEEEGLQIETSIVANPPAGLAAVQGGQVDVAYAPSIPILNALSQGVPITVIAAADGYPEDGVPAAEAENVDDTGLYASSSSGVTSVADLEGKTIAIPARKAQLEVVIAGELEKAGIDPATGVNWVVLDFTSAVAGLQNGTVDAAGLVSPFTTEAAEAGNELIASPSVGFFESGATGLWTAGTDTVEKKSDAIAAFQRAVVKSNAYATEHPEEVIQAGLDYTDSELSIDDVKTPIWPSEVLPEDLERPNEKMVQLGFLPTPVDLDGVILSIG